MVEPTPKVVHPAPPHGFSSSPIDVLGYALLLTVVPWCLYDFMYFLGFYGCASIFGGLGSQGGASVHVFEVLSKKQEESGRQRAIAVRPRNGELFFHETRCKNTSFQ